MKIRTPAASALPASIVPWVARFDGKCLCGKKIRRGQNCLYDKFVRKLICRTCSNRARKGLLPPRPPTEAEIAMDRVKQLWVLPKPLDQDHQAELNHLIGQLKERFADDYSARRLLVEVFNIRLDPDIICIAMRYSDNCYACGDKILKGTAAIWTKSSHRIWCLECSIVIG